MQSSFLVVFIGSEVANVYLTMFHISRRITVIHSFGNMWRKLS